MATPKHQVVIDKVSVTKIWDKKMGKTACEALGAGAEKALGSSTTEVVKAIAANGKGYRLSLTVESLELDQKANALIGSVKGILTELPADKYLAGLSGGGKIPGPNAKKMETEVKDLMTSLGESLGEKARKALP